MSKRLLFLCTGNYYRSRYAELLFNALAPATGLDWLADSRGLNLEAGKNNVGPMSPFTVQRLTRRGIALPAPRFPLQAVAADFAGADRVIALDEVEHRPLMLERFPDWADRIEYWQVHDIGFTLPDVALAQIDTQVDETLKKLAAARGG